MSGSAETHALPHASGDAGYIAESNAQHSYHVRSNAGHQGVPTLVSSLAMQPICFSKLLQWRCPCLCWLLLRYIQRANPTVRKR